jgi:NAD(P)-dependent dehydrogenase (short-subunit alcohol dehydrogenase family)
VNQLAHHALAAHLAPCLVAGAAATGAPSRVVAVASAAATWPGAAGALSAALDGDAAALAAGGAPWAPYAASKRANVAWVRAASQHCDAAVLQHIALHPGAAPSGLQRHMGPLGAALNALTTAIGGSADRHV